MINYTYYFATTASDANSSARFDHKTFKGPTALTFNFDNVNQTAYPAFKLNVDWGDGSERSLQSGSISLSSGLVDLALKPISHTYYPSVCAYFTGLTAQVQIIFANFKSYFAVIPITLAQTSYFKQYKTLNLVDAQFVDNPSNDVFTIFQSELNDIYNVVLQLPS